MNDIERLSFTGLAAYVAALEAGSSTPTALTRAQCAEIAAEREARQVALAGHVPVTPVHVRYL